MMLDLIKDKLYKQQLPIDLLFSISLAIAAAQMMAFVNRVRDLSLHDETSYLNSGVQLLQAGLPDAQNAPLYAIWYFGIHGLTENNIDLFFFNFQLLVVLNAVLFYIYLRTLQIKLFILESPIKLDRWAI
ncbi:MAG: hypothetical protein F6K03_00245 [Kamptonema sp. SIO4C4]|nr:hypothetical protein [Kamptonema sp. SIO4C4]